MTAIVIIGIAIIIIKTNQSKNIKLSRPNNKLLNNRRPFHESDTILVAMTIPSANAIQNVIIAINVPSNCKIMEPFLVLFGSNVINLFCVCVCVCVCVCMRVQQKEIPDANTMCVRRKQIRNTNTNTNAKLLILFEIRNSKQSCTVTYGNSNTIFNITCTQNTTKIPTHAKNTITYTPLKTCNPLLPLCTDLTCIVL
jgi:hypothetical protein